MAAPDAPPRLPRLSPRQDLVFKLLFSRHHALLVDMLEAVLGRKIRSVEVLNPELPADVTNAKIVALDLRVVLDDGSRVDVEIQARALPDNPARFLFYAAREYTSQLSQGKDYSLLRPAVSVVWLVESMFPDLDQLHSVFKLREIATGRLYSDHLELHVLQLAKLPFAGQDQPQLRRWARFLAAQSEEEYAALSQEDQVMAQATQALDAISADPETQRMARDRADSEKLYAMSLRASRAEGREEGVAEGLELGHEEGVKSSLLRFLAARQLELTPAQRAMIDNADLPTLERWTDLAFSGTDLDELFAG